MFIKKQINNATTWQVIIQSFWIDVHWQRFCKKKLFLNSAPFNMILCVEIIQGVSIFNISKVFCFSFIYFMISHSSLASPSYLDYDENKVRQGGEKYAIKAQRYYDQYLERIDVNNAEKLRKLLIKSALKGKYEAQSHLAFLVKNADELAGWTLIAARHNAESKEADVIRKFCPNSLHPSCSLRRAHKKWKRSLNKIMSNQKSYFAVRKSQMNIYCTS
ncbi:unnamed protein product [Paramecium sonneborni]|uniref:Uncharacterized protein n=1 Tax=Paramecium sonneborni TaxID=65129 RepID=A0A8S1RRS7_9CILI|nr:unnamed protein product [Paramecium sonneborni]